MKGTCIIVEDQPPAQRVLQKYIEDLGGLELKGVFSDALKALEFLNTEGADLMFLDIHLPKISGIEFLKMLKNRPKVILTTAFSDYALEGYELDVSDYLLKPFSFQRFVKAVNKTLTTDGLATSGSVPSNEEAQKPVSSSFIKSGTEYINIHFDEILFIKGDGDYTTVHVSDKRHLVSHSLKHWTSLLPVDSFCQVHKSYIVNVSKISKVIGNQIFIRDLIVPVGRTYKDVFSSRYL